MNPMPRVAAPRPRARRAALARAALATLSAAAPAAERSLALTATRPLDFAVAARQLDEARNRLNPQTGSTVYTLDRKAIDELPQGPNTPLNQVLLQTPGMAQDSFG